MSRLHFVDGLYLTDTDHLSQEEISEKDRAFILEKLFLNDKDKIEIGGWLTLPMMVLWLYASMAVLCLIAWLFGTLETDGTRSLLIFIVFSGCAVLTLRWSFKRKRIVKAIFITYQLYLLVVSLINYTELTMFELLWILTWLGYFIFSKRVKYTFVE
jgi:hypothetical protein